MAAARVRAAAVEATVVAAARLVVPVAPEGSTVMVAQTRRRAPVVEVVEVKAAALEGLKEG